MGTAGSLLLPRCAPSVAAIGGEHWFHTAHTAPRALTAGKGRLESDPGLPCVPALPSCGVEQFSLLSACVRIGFPERVCLKQGSVAWYVKSLCLSTGWRVHAPASTDSDRQQAEIRRSSGDHIG